MFQAQPGASRRRIAQQGLWRDRRARIQNSNPVRPAAFVHRDLSGVSAIGDDEIVFPQEWNEKSLINPIIDHQVQSMNEDHGSSPGNAGQQCRYGSDQPTAAQHQIKACLFGGSPSFQQRRRQKRKRRWGALDGLYTGRHELAAALWPNQGYIKLGCQRFNGMLHQALHAASEWWVVTRNNQDRFATQKDRLRLLAAAISAGPICTRVTPSTASWQPSRRYGPSCSPEAPCTLYGICRAP